jgi:hypothetical protein
MDQDLPFTFIIGIPARHTINNTTVGVSISTRPAIKTAHTPSGEALRHANPLENPVGCKYYPSMSAYSCRGCAVV